MEKGEYLLLASFGIQLIRFARGGEVTIVLVGLLPTERHTGSQSFGNGRRDALHGRDGSPVGEIGLKSQKIKLLTMY